MKRQIPVFLWASMLGASALAQDNIVERQFRGVAGSDIRVGIYLHVRPDCTSGALPTIRLIDEPAHGKITIKKANVSATNYKQCLALEVPGFVAFYRSSPGFSGTDRLTMEIKFPNGRTEMQKITVTVVGSVLGL